MIKANKVMHSYMSDIEDNSILFKLLKEIEMVAEYPLDTHHYKGMVIHYLKDLRARRPITKYSIDAVPNSSTFILRHKIRTIKDHQLLKLCVEIANNKKSELEDVKGMSLYVFLDRYLKDVVKTKKRKPKPLPGYAYP